MNEGNKEDTGKSRNRGRRGSPHTHTVPALTPTSSRPSMIISKEPALRLKPNRVAAATTKMLFTSRDFFLGEVKHRRERWVQS